MPSMSIYIHLPRRRGSRPWRVLPWQPARGAMSWWGAVPARNKLISEVGETIGHSFAEFRVCYFCLRVKFPKHSLSFESPVGVNHPRHDVMQETRVLQHPRASLLRQQHWISSGSCLCRAPGESSCWQFTSLLKNPKKKLKLQGSEIEIISHICFQPEFGCWCFRMI